MDYATSSKKSIAWVMGLLIALMGFYVNIPAAHADGTGTINAFEIVQAADGVQTPNVLDENSSNGKVATNDRVIYNWTLNVTDVKGATFTQTLPAGWEWDRSTFTSINTSNDNYQASYALSPDGLTLTVTFDTTQTTNNPIGIGLNGLGAKPTESVQNQSTYTPTVTIDHPSAPTVAPGPSVEVLSQPTIVPQKARSAQNKSGTFDFGSGAEDARYIDYRIAVGDIDELIGARDTTLSQPATLRDSFTINMPAGLAVPTFIPVIIGASEPGALPTTSLAQVNAQTYDITLDGFEDLYGAWVDVRFWMKANEAPSGTQIPLIMKNTVNSNGITDTTGTPAVEIPGQNTAEGVIIEDPNGGPGGIGGWMHAKGIFAHNGTGLPPTTLDQDPTKSGQNYSSVSEAVVEAGSIAVSRMQMRPGQYLGTETSSPVRDLIVYDFWDPTQQQIVPDMGPYVGPAGWLGGAFERSTYTIEYTNGTDRSLEQLGNTWYGTIDEAGGVESVSGIRIKYLEDWGTNLKFDESYFIVAVPLRIVTTEATTLIDQGQWSFTDVNDVEHQGNNVAYVNTGSFMLSVGKSVDKSSVLGGDTLNFTIRPAVVPSFGAQPGTNVYGLKIVDTLAKGIARVDLSAVPPEWDVVSEEYTDEGIRITFEYVGTAKTGDSLPEITYQAVTSALAPEDSVFLNTAVISADFNAQTEERRTSRSTTTISQAQVVSEEKKVYGDNVLDVNAPQASWQTRWFNFQTSSQGLSYFVDLLPYDGDDNGSSFSGTATLASAVLLDGAGNPAPESYGNLAYTTATPAEIKKWTDNPVGYVPTPGAEPLVWVPAAGYDPDLLPEVTGVRAAVLDFVVGEPGIGSIRLSMNLEGMQGGDKLINVSSGWLTRNGRLGETNPAQIDIVSSSLGGIVWNDVDGSGTREDTEPRFPNVTVTLHDGDGNQIASTTTGADGSYRFAEIPAGNYIVRANSQTLGIDQKYVVQHTYDYDGDLNHDSGVIPVEKGVAFEPSIDFGYRVVESDIGLTKTGRLAKDSGLAVAGDRVNWEFVIQNRGGNLLTSVELIDHLPDVQDLQIDWSNATTAGQLEAGESVPATAWYALKQEDLDRGFVRNTATTLGLDPNLTEVTDDAEAIVTLPEGGSMLLEKIGALIGDPALGAEIRWEFSLRNTGNVSLTGISLQDALPGLSDITWGTWPGTEFTLAPNESVTASASSSLTQADLDAGCVVNTATAWGVTPGGVDAPSNEADDEVCFGVERSISLVKTTNGVVYTEAPGARLEAGDAVLWEYLVTNTGSSTLSNVLLIDDQEGEITFPEGFDGTLDPAESVTFSASGVAAIQQYHNIATVTANDPQNVTVTDTDQSWYLALDSAAPGFDLVKTADPVSGTSVLEGEKITYTITGTNTGATVLDPVTISDDLSDLVDHVTYNGDAVAAIGDQTQAGVLEVQFDAGTLNWSGVLQPGEAVTITFSVTVNEGAGGETLENVVTGSGQPPGPVPPITPQPPPTVHPVPLPGFQVTKSANPADGTQVQPGQRITYTVTGSNTGDMRLDPVVITDDLTGVVAHARYNGDATATIDGTSAAGQLVYNASTSMLEWTGTLNPGETVTVTYSVLVNANAGGKTLNNSVVGSAQPPGEHPPIETPRVSVKHPVPVPLATTGASDQLLPLAAGASLLLAAGLSVLLLRKRRTSH